ncbi:MAG: hypothetical protein WBD87_06020 [Candidatus Acidiferrales bacterium]
MNIKDTHLDALKELGYMEDEARFLYIAATHSGYFTVSQYLSFAGIPSGKRSYKFTNKVFSNRHANPRAYAQNARVFHLFSRKMYARIGKENIRNRRDHEFQFMRTRLMALDFILANQGHNYFETERDKVQYFTEGLGIEKSFLPTKLYLGTKTSSITPRYFVDKFPMFFPARGIPSVVTFSYVEPQAENLSAFVTHLQSYLPLFRKLEQFGFLFISASDTLSTKATEIFGALVKGPLEQPAALELTRYFRVRKAWEEKRFAELKNEDIEFLSEATARFKSEQCQELYRSWKSGHIAESDIASIFGHSNGTRQIAFETCLVKQQPFLHRTAMRKG